MESNPSETALNLVKIFCGDRIDESNARLISDVLDVIAVVSNDPDPLYHVCHKLRAFDADAIAPKPVNPWIQD